MDKEDVVATHDEILLGHKKGKTAPFFSSLDGPRDWQSDVSQTEKEKYRMISLTCRIYKKKDTNELIYKTEAESWG